jgi:hypothetical protein
MRVRGVCAYARTFVFTCGGVGCRHTAHAGTDIAICVPPTHVSWAIALVLIISTVHSKQAPPFSKQGLPLFPGTKTPHSWFPKVKPLGNCHRNDSLSGVLVGEDTQKHRGGDEQEGVGSLK